MKKNRIPALSILWIGTFIALAIAYFGREEPSFAGIVPVIVVTICVLGTAALFITGEET